MSNVESCLHVLSTPNEQIGEPIVKSDGQAFNSIFGLSRKNYEKRVKAFREANSQELR